MGVSQLNGIESHSDLVFMQAPLIVSIVLVTYWTVLAVELIGDKTIYTVASLATRYEFASVYAGISVAFAGKVLVAVLLGQVLTGLPRQVISAVSAATFFATAVLLWKERSEPGSSPDNWAAPWPDGFTISFLAIFLSEWADVGQISTAALAAQYRMPLPVCVGATAALMTKGLLALTLGKQLRRHIPTRVLRMAAVGSCCILGTISLRA